MTGSNGTKDKENTAHKPGDQLRANLKKRKAQASKRANIKANIKAGNPNSDGPNSDGPNSDGPNSDGKAEKAKGN